jgi:gamma-butyrobetaine dioxygenase
MVLAVQNELKKNSSNISYDVHAVLENGHVQIASGTNTRFELPNLWLRDNCLCDECRNVETEEKSFILSTVSCDLTPSMVDLTQGILSIGWPDGHQSDYVLADILELSKERHAPSMSWKKGFQPEYVDWTSFLADDAIALEALTTFLQIGVMVIDGAPSQSNSLELLASRLGPIREVLFDRIHNVCLETRVYNVAHTALALPPHNDFASYSFPPSAQALHMLENGAEKGRSIILDAWAVAEKIRRQRPDFFTTLCDFAVPFRQFDEDNETYAVEPIIKCDSGGNIISVRFSNQLMQAIDPMRTGVNDFYQAYHCLCCHMTDSDNHVKFRLEGGHVLLVAAHRVLHAREAFVPSGKRHLQDAYFELDNIANKVITLNKHKGARYD